MISFLANIIVWIIVIGIIVGVPVFLIRFGNTQQRRTYDHKLEEMNKVRQQRFLDRELPLQEKERQEKMRKLSAPVEKE